MASELYIVGVNHRSTPVAVRERLDMGNGRLERFLGDLREMPEVDEAVVLSTCNRVEIVACAPPDDRTTTRLIDALGRSGGLQATDLQAYAFELSGREAVRHVFRVAASLDSMVVGEPQILGQMKEQFGVSTKSAVAGPVLTRVFHKSFSVAKRIRSETGIATRAVSVASAAADLAGRIFETLQDRTVLLIGTGEIAEAAANHFVSAGVSRVMVANRTFENAVEFVRQYSGTPIAFERVGKYLPLADLVVGSSGGGQLVSQDDVRAVLRERKNRPMFFIDLAVPRNFDPAINDLDNVYLYDIDALTTVVDENLGERQREALHGEAIVEEEVDKFWQWVEKLDITPTIVQLRDFAEGVRREELSKTSSRLGHLDGQDLDRIDQMTKSIVNKILHAPTDVLKDEATTDSGLTLIDSLRRLFRLGSHD